MSSNCRQDCENKFLSYGVSAAINLYTRFRKRNKYEFFIATHLSFLFHFKSMRIPKHESATYVLLNDASVNQLVVLLIYASSPTRLEWLCIRTKPPIRIKPSRSYAVTGLSISWHLTMEGMQLLFLMEEKPMV